MATMTKKKPVGKFLIYGILSFILYYILLAKQDLITEYFTKGRFYALLPIATAFVFSFIHGNTTDLFWKVLGVEAKKRREVK
ncbi:hypothetical protein THC_0879 [Caldimicrobium thiodismutans]|uniref:Uncharacterized protein n=1 Tax=Caldimicrobium thiodismutans TaxID=1653476 RepID=A0A0U5B5B7_9BACT|nr:hypothetical protein [Caldimicrobium thiodismutans]BAU23264.1 hypothetical protein THC_0879 [Caldimicrobium thiodismutans]